MYKKATNQYMKSKISVLMDTKYKSMEVAHTKVIRWKYAFQTKYLLVSCLYAK